ncbi:MAG: YopX family protein [Cetobacterium sp.]
MRSIKFRCWDIIHKKMRGTKDLWDIPYNEIFINTPDQRALNVMQYIGMNDVKGKEIYEGDILKCSSMLYPDIVHIGIIEYIKGEFQIKWVNDDISVRWDIRFWVEERVAEIIGNIYENQEIISIMKSM